MNNGDSDPPGGSPNDSREKWITIDRLCDAYEASLQEGDVERAPFLVGVPDDWRPELKRELDAIDAAYHDAKETREQTIKVPATDRNSRRLPTKGRLAELAALDRDKVWLGRFEIIRRLGTGATGSVWCARDARLARWVALKVPHASRVMSETSAARFQTEARAAAAISHPNVVQVHEVLIEDGLPILIQQWIDGPSLAKVMKDKGPLDFDQAAGWMSQIADAVACAHEKGIVHRDLKPANVMLNKDRPMVLDFGLASYPQFSSGLTTEGTVLGTPAYMSPEQAEGAEHANQPPTDIYALGTILYEMLVGTPPFVGTAREVIQANKTAIPTPPRNRRSSVPRDLETIALRCMAKSPSARYRSAAELRDDLDRYRRREPIRARKVSMVENVWSWCRLHPAYALLATGVPVVVFLMLAVFVSRLQSKQLSYRANKLARDYQVTTSERDSLIAQRHMVQLSRASHELSEGNRSRGLELLRNIPKDVRGWEWRLLDMISHSPSENLNSGLPVENQMQIVTALAVSRKHRKIFSAQSDGTVWVRRLPKDEKFFSREKKDRDEVGTPSLLMRSSKGIAAMTVDDSGDRLAWVDEDGNVTLWDVGENERSQLIEPPKTKHPYALAFSTDSKRLLVAGGSSGSSSVPADSKSWLLSYRLSDSGEYVLAIDKRWGRRPAITSLCFQSEDTFFMTRGRSNGTIGSVGAVDSWIATEDGLTESKVVWRGVAMRGLDWSRSAHRISWCDDGGIAYVKELGLPASVPPRQFRASRRSASQTRFSPDGLELIVTGGDGEVSRWAVPAIPSLERLKKAGTTNNESAAADPETKKASASKSASTPAAPSAEAGGKSDDRADAIGTRDPSVTVPQKPVVAETKTPNLASIVPPPVRHIRDYRGHENAVMDAIFLAPCQKVLESQEDAEELPPNLRFCRPFLVTGGEDGRVLRWFNGGRKEIESVSITERPLLDATWISPRQIVTAASAARRVKSVQYKNVSLPDQELTVELRQVAYLKALTSIESVDSTSRTGPPRYAACSRDTAFLFQTGDSSVLTTRTAADQDGLSFNSALMIDSRYLVVASSQPHRRSKEEIKANPNAARIIRLPSLFLYDTDNDEDPPRELKLPGRGFVTCMRLAEDGKRIFAGTAAGKVLEVLLRSDEVDMLAWSDRPVKTLNAHDAAVRDLAYLGNQQKLATVSDDGMCLIWDIEALSDSLDHRAVLTDLDQISDNATAQIETPLSAEEPSREVRKPTQQLFVSGSPVSGVTTCGNGSRLVTVDQERVIRIWDTESGLELVALQPRKETVVAVEFSPDDRFLMIAEKGGRIDVIRLAK